MYPFQGIAPHLMHYSQGGAVAYPGLIYAALSGQEPTLVNQEGRDSMC